MHYGYDKYAETVHDKMQHFAFHAIVEPTTIEEAQFSDQATQWKAATDSEYKSLIDNNTCELVNLPEGRRPIGCKWVFKVNDQEGTVERFKGRLVAKSYSQRSGIHYDEIFSPFLRFTTNQTLLAFPVEKGMLVHQIPTWGAG